MQDEPRIVKEVNEDIAYYTIFWSELRKADKFDIVSVVPSISGFFELYFKDEKGKLNLFFVSKAYYGGLKSTIRKTTDPELETNKNRRKILDKFDCYYRFAPTNSYKDMSDILFFFSKTYFPEAPAPEHSGRYEDIFVKEISPDKLVDI